VEDGFAYPDYNRFYGLFFIGGEITEHISNNLIFAGGFQRSADTYLNAGEIPASKFTDDRVNPFVTAGTATLSDSEPAQRKVKVIMYNDNVIRSYLELINQSAHRLTAQVHIGLGPGQYNLDIFYSTGAGSSPALFFIEADALLFSKVIQANKTYIMAIIGITATRIA
jgi:hypothetical protein